MAHEETLEYRLKVKKNPGIFALLRGKPGDTVYSEDTLLIRPGTELIETKIHDAQTRKEIIGTLTIFYRKFAEEQNRNTNLTMNMNYNYLRDGGYIQERHLSIIGLSLDQVRSAAFELITKA